MLKRILFGAGALLLLLVAVVIGRTLMIPAAKLAEAGAPASIDALPAIAERLAGSRVEILLDGGIRRGGDIARARARGADACLMGRAQAFAIAGGGAAGLASLLEHVALEWRTVSTLAQVTPPDRQALR